MGGVGSGRRTSRSTVEESLILDINCLVKRGFLRRGFYVESILHWTLLTDGRNVASCDFVYDTTDKDYIINLSYTYHESETVSSSIKLEKVPEYFGGTRLYFICPECGRRTWHLYLTAVVKCRICHNLTYQSCRESHKWDRLYAKMVPALGSMKEVRRLMNFHIRQAAKWRKNQMRG